MFFWLFYIIIVSSIGLSSSIGGILYLVAFMLGGFIVAYLAKEKKIGYGIYEGICITILIILNTVFSGSIINLYLFIPGVLLLSYLQVLVVL